MKKNLIIIALSAALITRECPWFNNGPWDEQTAIWLGFSMCLLFFCLFWREEREKWLKSRYRIRRMREMIIRIRSIRRAG